MTPAMFDAELVAALPMLRKIAIKLGCRKADADDLVQATCERALLKRDLYQTQGTTALAAWLSIICRNLFYDRYRQQQVHAKYFAPHDPETISPPVTLPNQEQSVFLGELAHRLDLLTIEQRRVFDIVAGGGSYDLAAEQVGVPVGTVRSRLYRARRLLEGSPSR